jgi:hypothetical protein
MPLTAPLTINIPNLTVVDPHLPVSWFRGIITLKVDALALSMS